ncbi:hypothetical protein C6A85_74620, partial [Mycobacterium sp. ITM-2017-0098]
MYCLFVSWKRTVGTAAGAVAIFVGGAVGGDAVVTVTKPITGPVYRFFGFEKDDVPSVEPFKPDCEQYRPRDGGNVAYIQVRPNAQSCWV